MPAEWTPWLVALVAACVVVYGFSKTAIPGVGMLAGTMVAAFLGPAAAAGFVLPLLIVGDVIAIARYRKGANWRIIGGLLPWLFVGLLLATAAFAVLDRSTLSRVLGALILLSVCLEVLRRRQEARANAAKAAAGPGAEPRLATTGPGEGAHRLAAGFFGILAGMTTMVANAGGAAFTLYLLRRRINILGFLGTSAWFWFIVNTSKVPLSVWLGQINAESLHYDLLFLPCLLLGTAIGIWLLPHISQRVFTNAVLSLSAVAAVWLVIHG